MFLDIVLDKWKVCWTPPPPKKIRRKKLKTEDTKPLEQTILGIYQIGKPVLMQFIKDKKV